MIEIILKGDDALQYIQNEKLQDSKYEALLNEYNMLMTLYNELLTRRQEDRQVSARVKSDTEKLDKPKVLFNHKAPEPDEELPEPKEPVSRARWTTSEINQLHAYANSKSPSINCIEHCKVKLPHRTEAAIRSKLNELNVFVVDGRLSLGFNYTKA